MDALFIMPHYTTDFAKSSKFLNEAIESVLSQSDQHWKLLIIDDKSPDEAARDYLKELQSVYREKIFVFFNTENIGPGLVRNIGVGFAEKMGCPFILYLDSDDISHCSRLRITREIFESNSNVSLVYSSFEVIDENSNAVDYDNLDFSIKEILDGHKTPLQGINTWVDIGTTTGYTNLTSATAVRTNLAVKYPFPAERVSEDMHTWLRYSAGGDEFFFTPLIMCKYRIPQYTEGSSSRSREGGASKFYREKSRVDEDGFIRALDIAIKSGKILEVNREVLLRKFYARLAETFLRVNQIDLHQELLSKSKRLAIGDIIPKF